jgi:hypothetical protein
MDKYGLVRLISDHSGPTVLLMKFSDVLTCRSLIGSSIEENAICKTAKDRQGLAGGASDNQVNKNLNGMEE